jgi:uncharacterized membrane protein
MTIDQKRYEITIDRPADACFDLFCEVEKLPEWLPEVRSARVRDFDDEGRAEAVDFMASLERGGLVYTLTYSYAPSELEVSWESVDRAGPRSLQGSARFVPTSESACRMVYEIRVDLAADLQPWVTDRYRERPGQDLCLAFKQWAESQ